MQLSNFNTLLEFIVFVPSYSSFLKNFSKDIWGLAYLLEKKAHLGSAGI